MHFDLIWFTINVYLILIYDACFIRIYAQNEFNGAILDMEPSLTPCRCSFGESSSGQPNHAGSDLEWATNHYVNWLAITYTVSHLSKHSMFVTGHVFSPHYPAILVLYASVSLCAHSPATSSFTEPRCNWLPGKRVTMWRDWVHSIPIFHTRRDANYNTIVEASHTTEA
jgi:hypothetical protein